MDANKFENKILDAIQAVVEHEIANANFDKTIRATIVSIEDETIGKYKIKYQDSTLIAYSTSTEVKYPKNSRVYVLIPNGDMSQEKTIIGSIDKLGTDYINTISPEEKYENVGTNILNTGKEIFGLCSYRLTDEKVLYDRENNINLINLNSKDAEVYLSKSGSILCGAEFQTDLQKEQKFKGNYGISFILLFKDNNTGKDIKREYIIDIDNMSGSPYEFVNFEKQYGIYNIDTENFLSIEKITIFSKDFPNQDENRPNDIFIKNIQLMGKNALKEEEISNCSLSFITPKGIYFDTFSLDTDSREIHAQIRVKGKTVDTSSQSLKYYWFMENNSINMTHEKYFNLGGLGWECLNNYNVINSSMDASSIEWIPGDYIFITKKIDNSAIENKYKCVVVYNNETVLSKEFSIYNYSSDFNIEIISDSGTQFYFDVGSPNLTCLINGVDLVNNPEYKFTWSVLNNNNKFTSLPETIYQNEEYNNLELELNNLNQQIKEEKILKEQVQDRLDELNALLKDYAEIQRVEKNKIYNLNIREITLFSIYKCSVFKNNIHIGTASIAIRNSLEANKNGYSLVISEGNQTYKYNEAGVSPASKSLINPVIIKPLGFILYDENNNIINQDSIPKPYIKWRVPKKNTMLSIKDEYGDPAEETEDEYIYTNLPQLGYDISNKYDGEKLNNNIKLEINYKGILLRASTNLTLIKEGESGTNGTEFICKIIPNTSDTNFTEYPAIIYNEALKTYKINFDTASVLKWFKIQLWHNGENIFEDTQTGNSTEEKQVEVKWEILKNTYGKNITEQSEISVNAETGEFNYTRNENITDPAHIVKATVKYNNVIYYATIPITTIILSSSVYEAEVKQNTGFRYVLYSADGQDPKYDNTNPFEIKFYQDIDGIKTDISTLESSNYKVDYEWSEKGIIYTSKWQSSLNLIKDSIKNKKKEKNQIYYQPIDSFNGMCVTNAIYCLVKRGNTILAKIHIPIHLYLNRYGNSAMNGWDGNSISINEENGIILAPQVGAGTKNEDNSFTGVFMGSIKEADSDAIEHGLFGYNSGERTISLNASDGSARFGKTGSGQIVIDPSTGEAVIRSGDYREGESGMEINLSEPSIKFGNGNFKVDNNGMMFATGYATDKELEEVDTRIDVKAGEVSAELSKKYDASIKNLQNQIDGTVQFWNGPVVPYPLAPDHLNEWNYPANEWTTEADRNNHRADIYSVIYDENGDKKQGKSYRFDKVGENWVWVEITDNELSAVQALAQQALDGVEGLKENEIKTLQEETVSLRSGIDEMGASLEANVTKIEENISLVQALAAPISNAEGGTTLVFDEAYDVPVYDNIIYGKTEQITRSGKNLYNINDIHFRDTAITVDADDWVTMTKDNSSNTNLVYINNYLNPSKNLKTNTTYYIVFEVKAVSGNGSIEVTSLHNTNKTGQFTTSNSYKYSDLKAGDVKKITAKTISDFTNCITMLRQFHTISAGQTGSITYRTSVFEKEIDADNFVYEKYGVMPSPDYPGEIKTIKGIENIIPTNPEDWEQGTTTGASTTRLRTKNLIPVNGTKDYFISLENTDYCFLNISMFKADGTLIEHYYNVVSSVINGSRDLKINFKNPECTQVRFIIRRVNETNTPMYPEDILNIRPMCVEGTVKKPFAPHGYSYIVNSVIGKNLLPYYPKSQTIGGVTFTVNEDNSITLNGTATENIYYDMLDRTRNYIIPAGNYTGTLNVTGIDNGLVLYIRKDSGTYYTLANGTTNWAVAVEEDFEYNRSYLYIVKNKAFSNLTIYPQLQAGNEITDEHEKYEEKIHYIPMNDSNGEKFELAQIGDIKDDYDITKGLLTKRIGKVVLDGSETITRGDLAESGSYRFYVTVPNAISITSTEQIPPILCNIATKNSRDIMYQGAEGVGYTSEGRIQLVLNEIKKMTSVEVNSWLKARYDAGTPVIIYYLLDAPETYIAMQTDIIPLEGYNRYSLFCDNKFNSIEALVQYYRKTLINEIFVSRQQSETDLKMLSDSIIASVNKTLEDNYGTKNEYEAAIKASESGILQQVTNTYATKTEMSDAKAQAIKEANSQTTNALKDYSTKVETSSMIDTQISGIQSSVSKTISTTEDKLRQEILAKAEEMNGKLDGYAPKDSVVELQNKVTSAITDSQFAIDVVTEISQNGVSKVVAKEGFVFDDKGLSISDSGAETKSLVNEKGIQITTNDNDSLEVFYAGYVDKEKVDSNADYQPYLNESVVYTHNLIASHYLAIGTRSRIEDFGKDSDTDHGTGIFYTGK